MAITPQTWLGDTLKRLEIRYEQDMAAIRKKYFEDCQACRRAFAIQNNVTDVELNHARVSAETKTGRKSIGELVRDVLSAEPDKEFTIAAVVHAISLRVREWEAPTYHSVAAALNRMFYNKTVHKRWDENNTKHRSWYKWRAP